MMQTRTATHPMQRLRSTLCVAVGLTLITGFSHAAPPVTNYEYDANGNMTKITDGLGNATVQQYDALNRMVKQQQPNPSAAGQLGEIDMQYNAIDQMTAVIDPRNLTTSYAYDALNDLKSLTSPDTGAMINTYDDAGNLKTKQDAKGQITTYDYDALNRLTLITFAAFSAPISYTYDQGVNGIGRLYQIDDGLSTTTYSYDLNGRVTDEARSIDGYIYTTSYGYNSEGQLTSISYPTSTVVTYGRDSLGRINEVTITKNGQQQIIATNITYLPFGGIQSFTYGNGSVFNRAYDTDYRIDAYTLGSKTINVAYDAASRITALNNPANTAENKTYGYDNLDRLTSQVTSTSSKTYDYDLTGNRISQGAGANNYTNTIDSASNRLTASTAPTSPSLTTYDANGSTKYRGNTYHHHDDRGRQNWSNNSTSGATAYYGINGLGQRITKTINGTITVYHYDINGQLIAETDHLGVTKEETIYLGKMPIAVMK